MNKNKYRVALMKCGSLYYTSTQDSIIKNRFNPEMEEDFIKWLTDWVEYEIN